MPTPMLLARADKDVSLLPKMANRHGLIAGATGTGKTITLRLLAEGFSRMGVPVFMADVKGDLTGMARAGGDHPKIVERAQQLGLDDFAAEAYPVTFWDVFGQQGHPVRTTVSDMGPLLLTRLLNLNEVQGGVLSLVFRIADDNGLLLLDLKDLQSMVRYVGENAREYTTEYGNISAASIGAIQRRLLGLEDQGGDKFFGEPALNLADFIQTADDGRGMINILAANQLILSPQLYATFLLWLLSELFEQLPEIGDPEKPKLVFFFDEAHLLFDEAPKTLQDKIEQVVRLIRSKGVGVYFVSQSPRDIPDDVLGQLGNRIQHALRAFTPKDQKAVRVAAETFRPNPRLDTAAVITELGVGEALLSVLDAKGAPTIVERALICPPRSRLQPLTEAERAQVIQGSLLYGHYERDIDRQSAYEILQERASQAEAQAQQQAADKAAQKPAPPRGRKKDNLVESFAKSAARSIGSQVGRSLIRGVLGSLFGGRR
ncbi:helicase HerA-like domain-containing protein [Trichloromonas sp.]|uniref:helicase HerA-like domain-containing protein n=1 Tax=Trichloromonas sp. TaxID=3069249 RepID=UPI003D81AE4E